MRQIFVEDHISNHVTEPYLKEEVERDRQHKLKIAYQMRNEYDDLSILDQVNEEVNKLVEDYNNDQAKTKNQKKFK